MSSSKRLSVVLPVKLPAPGLGRAVSTTLAQLTPDDELLVVLSGETRPNVLPTQSWLKNPLVKVICQPVAGVVAAANKGNWVANGDFIARTDADDENLPLRFDLQVSYLRANPSIDAVACAVAFGGDNITRAGMAYYVQWSNQLLTPEQIFLNRFVEMPIINPTTMVRRNSLLAYGGFENGDFPEDYHLWLSWLHQGARLAKLPQPLYKWNDPPNRLTFTDPRYRTDAFYKTKAFWLAKWLATNRPKMPVWVWGAGKTARKRAALMQQWGVGIEKYIDIDPKKINQNNVVSPDALPPPGRVFVLSYVGSRGARLLIKNALQQKKYTEGVHFYLCA